MKIYEKLAIEKSKHLRAEPFLHGIAAAMFEVGYLAAIEQLRSKECENAWFSPQDDSQYHLADWLEREVE